MPAQIPDEAPLEVFAECADWLILIGGRAVQAYGVDRMTFDADCAVLIEDEGRLKEALGRVGYVLEEPRETFIRFVHLGRQRPVVDAMRLDAETYRKLMAETRLVQVGGFLLRVPAPLHLVAMKLHALKQNPERDYKDWVDIRHLLEKHPEGWTREDLQGIVGRYASEEIRERLRRLGFIP